ncbi:MAG: 1-(5-phosphoribosyl)-5-[(5-phosphoribosylamino)methylideneamino]imidazole-4-carboxamide isomerase [Solirubrobacterales bacterium]|nr:1-(5-phosphoribosyl)-5-[(5-phosphoribosylamino)methylideneamino]imidazole-4-carboxamide isomerase [Solirubrobacterales bacterium]
MILLPAIDILGGKAVRLDQGDYARRTDYYADPLDAAKAWVDQGAEELHIVDLDGAKQGAPVNLKHIDRIVETLGIPVELGGGIRADGPLHDVFSAGAARAIIGTAAFKDPEFLDRAVQAHQDRLVVSVDTRGGKVAAAGWLEQTDLSTEAAFQGLQERGVKNFVYSSIERDGMLSGPDLDGARQVNELGASFVYSGGISSLADLEALAAANLTNITGVIVGKALFERRFTVAEGQRCITNA